MIKFVMATIIGFGLTDLALAGTTVSYWGATQEENRQLSELYAARREGQLAKLKCLDRVLEEHPDNVAARSARASALMTMGRLDEALKDIDEIARRNPEFIALPNRRARYYRIKGDRSKELEEMKNLAARKFTNDTAKAFAGAIRWNRPRIAELSGNMVLAKKEWQTRVNSSRSQRAYSMTNQVRFYLRQGDYEEAVAVAKAAVELDRRQSYKDRTLVDTLTWYGFSLWISGKRTEALAAFLDAAEQPNDESRFSPGPLFYRRILAILSARVLAANGTEKDKARAAKLMSDLSKSVSGKRPYSLESAVLALSGGSEMKPVVDTVAKVLKQAPNSNWALWAAMYLGLSGQDEAKPLLKLLPNGTIQKRIAEQEGNAPGP